VNNIVDIFYTIRKEQRDLEVAKADITYYTTKIDRQLLDNRQTNSRNNKLGEFQIEKRKTEAELKELKNKRTPDNDNENKRLEKRKL